MVVQSSCGQQGLIELGVIAQCWYCFSLLFFVFLFGGGWVMVRMSRGLLRMHIGPRVLACPNLHCKAASRLVHRAIIQRNTTNSPCNQHHTAFKSVMATIRACQYKHNTHGHDDLRIFQDNLSHPSWLIQWQMMLCTLSLCFLDEASWAAIVAPIFCCYMLFLSLSLSCVFAQYSGATKGCWKYGLALRLLDTSM